MIKAEIPKIVKERKSTDVRQARNVAERMMQVAEPFMTDMDKKEKRYFIKQVIIAMGRMV